MDHANFELAKATLLDVSGIAIELGVVVVNSKLGTFGSLLAIFHLELHSKKGNEIDQALKERLREMLKLVEKACAWPECKETSGFATLKKVEKTATKGRSIPLLGALFPKNSLHGKIRRCLGLYASSTDEFKRLLEEIEMITFPKKIFNLAPEAAEMVEEASDYPTRVNNELYSTLRSTLSLCECQHSTRLRLDPRCHIHEKDLVHFEVLFSTKLNSTYSTAAMGWKETKMLVPSKDKKKKQAHIGDFTDIPTSSTTALLPEDDVEAASLERFCTTLNCTEDIPLCFEIENSRLKRKDEKVTLLRKVEATDSTPLSKALMTCKMPRRTRFVLAYTLAKAVWQYYGSPWMGDLWTRDNIHLLIDQSVQGICSSSSHLFRPYFAPDLHDDRESTPDYCEEKSFVHRSPKILALGILLIEVAQGRPFQPNTPLRYTRESTTKYLTSAWSLLREEGLFGKGDDDIPRYCRAVEGCLSYDHLFEGPCTPGKNQEEKDAGLLDRRAIIYREIVHPLEELLIGSGYTKRSNGPKQERNPVSKMTPSITPAKLNSKSTHSSHIVVNSANAKGSGDHSDSLLNSSRMASSSWIDKLLFVSHSISPPGHPASIRIAVIDTGCDPDAPIFLLDQQDARLRDHWKDWVEESPEPRDENGHGTAIVSLLLYILPNAEIFIARVAREEKDLGEADGLIAKAIEHAAMVWEADIVTMSFGFSTEKQSIKSAIRKAEEKRNDAIIFFAAAANEGSNSEELFPASHDSVIAIRGTDCDGAFVQRYDPEVAPFKSGMPLYGTLGKDVPWNWPDGDQLSSGCSIATPIAAAIAALITQCVAEDDQQRVRKREAILGVFHEISVCKSLGRRYINPRKLLDKAKQPNVAIIQKVLGGTS